MPASDGTRRSLAKVLAYRNPAVVERFRGEYPVTRKAAEGIWLETLRWLWLCSRTKKGQVLQVTPAMLVIDEMWHAFILYTRDYSAFCERHLGAYVHHQPSTHADTQQLFADIRANRPHVLARVEAQMRAQFELTAGELGTDTLKRWYVDYPVRYSPVVLRALRRKSLGASRTSG